MNDYTATLLWLIRGFAALVERWPTTMWFFTACWPLTLVLLVASGMRLW